MGAEMILKENIKQSIAQPGDVANILVALLMAEDNISRDREHFWVLGLNAQKMIKYIELSSLGTLTMSLIHPRETFRLAIGKGCNSIIVAHNHPSGDPTPSKDDKTITKRLQAAGDLLGIQVLDHVIIGTEGQFFSFSLKGLLK